MAFVSHEDKELDFKIVWYGTQDTALTQCLAEIADATGSGLGSATSAAVDDEITTGVLTWSMGIVGGWTTRFTLQTVPAQSPHPAHRLLIVKASDGAVFVASGDDGADRARADELRQHVEAHGYEWEAFPVVVITDGEPAAIGLDGRPAVDTAMAAMKAISKMALKTLSTA